MHLWKKKRKYSKYKRGEKTANLPLRISQRVTSSFEKHCENVKTDPNAVKIDYEIKIKIKVELLENENNQPRLDLDCIEETEDSNVVNERDCFDAHKAATDIIDNIVKKVLRSSPDKFHCEVCDYSARDNYNLKRHVETKHQCENIKCVVCGSVFDSKFSFSEHYHNCYFSCSYKDCGKTFKYSNRLDAHIRKNNNPWGQRGGGLGPTFCVPQILFCCNLNPQTKFNSSWEKKQQTRKRERKMP